MIQATIYVAEGVMQDLCGIRYILGYERIPVVVVTRPRCEIIVGSKGKSANFYVDFGELGIAVDWREIYEVLNKHGLLLC